jgi:hypothetical protein
LLLPGAVVVARPMLTAGEVAVVLAVVIVILPTTQILQQA